MKLSNCKFFKFFCIAVIAAICIYVGGWYYSAHFIENILNNTSNHKYNTLEVSYKKAAVTGFPFRYTLRLDEVKVKQDNIADLDLDSIQVTTTILFNSLNILLPKKIIAKFSYKESPYNLLITSAKDHYIEVEERNIFNTFKVINALGKEKPLEILDFYIKRLRVFSDELLVSNALTNKVISKQHIDIDAKCIEDSDDLLNSEIKVNSMIKILDTQAAPIHFLENISLNADVQLLTKPEGRINLIRYADIKNLDLLLNRTEVSLNGTVKLDKTNNTNLNLNLIITNWNELLDTLVQEHAMSQEKHYVILAAISSMSGAKPNVVTRDIGSSVINSVAKELGDKHDIGKTLINSVTNKDNSKDKEDSEEVPLKIRIFTDKQGDTRIGRLHMRNLRGHFNKFITTP